MKRRHLLLGLLAAGVLILLAVGALLLLTRANVGTARLEPDQVETLNGLQYNHYFRTLDGVKWHYVELAAASGDRPNIVFLHGIPSAWYAWHHVMAKLNDSYRVIAVDLKGLGLSEDPTVTTSTPGAYSGARVAGEIVKLMEQIGVTRFSLVTHEWGSVIGSYLAADHPDRVTHFIRLQAPLSDGAINQVVTLKNNPMIGRLVLADASGFVRRMYLGEASSIVMANVPGPTAVQPIAPEDVERIVKEFSYQNIPDAIVRYYTETPTDFRVSLPELAARTTMPVLLVQSDSDPIQPLSFYTDSAAPFPNARLQVLETCGHLPMFEQPAALADLIRTFVGG